MSSAVAGWFTRTGARGTAGTRHGGHAHGGLGRAGRGGKFRWATEVPGTEHGGRASHQYGLRELGPPPEPSALVREKRETRMLARHRQSLILQTVRSDGSARVSDLTQRLGVSDMTIRRDLESSPRWLVEKVHAARSCGNPASHEPASRPSLCSSDPRRSRSPGRGEPGQAGYRDSGGRGTTTFALASACSTCRTDHRHELAAVTNLFNGTRGLDGTADSWC